MKTARQVALGLALGFGLGLLFIGAVIWITSLVLK